MTSERERQVALVVSAAKKIEFAMDTADRFMSSGNNRMVLVIDESDVRSFEQDMKAWYRWCRENPNG